MGFIIVRYGDNQEKIINANCQSAVLLGHLKKSCGFSSLAEPLDLSTEAGEVLDLQSKPREYASKFIEPRSTCILVKVIRDDEDEENWACLLAGHALKLNGTSRIKKKTAKPLAKPVVVEEKKQTPPLVVDKKKKR